jgi:hypothetical protein
LRNCLCSLHQACPGRGVSRRPHPWELPRVALSRTSPGSENWLCSARPALTAWCGVGPSDPSETPVGPFVLSFYHYDTGVYVHRKMKIPGRTCLPGAARGHADLFPAWIYRRPAAAHQSSVTNHQSEGPSSPIPFFPADGSAAERSSSAFGGLPIRILPHRKMTASRILECGYFRDSTRMRAGGAAHMKSE